MKPKQSQINGIIKGSFLILSILIISFALYPSIAKAEITVDRTDVSDIYFSGDFIVNHPNKTFVQGEVINIDLFGTSSNGKVTLTSCSEIGMSDEIPYRHEGQYNIRPNFETIQIVNSAGTVVYSKELQFNVDWSTPGGNGIDSFCGIAEPENYSSGSWSFETSIAVGSLIPGDYEVQVIYSEEAPGACAQGVDPSPGCVWWGTYGASGGLVFHVIPPLPGTVKVRSNEYTGWVIDGPTPNSGYGGGPSGTFSGPDYPNSQPGSYTITPDQLTGYSLSITPSTTQVLTAGGSITFTLTYTLITPPSAGTIVVNSNRSTSWVISGTSTYTGSNQTTATYNDAPAGSYDLSPASIPGYGVIVTSNPSDGSLSPGGTLTFSIVYTDQSCQGNDAALNTHTVPSSLMVGEARTVTITMTNTCSTTWTQATGYKLGSQNSPSNLWSTGNQILIESPASNPNAPISKGENVTFALGMIAPSTPGTYHFKWQMQQNFSWFGDAADIIVQVTPGVTPYVDMKIKDQDVTAYANYGENVHFWVAGAYVHNCQASGTSPRWQGAATVPYDAWREVTESATYIITCDKDVGSGTVTDTVNLVVTPPSSGTLTFNIVYTLRNLPSPTNITAISPDCRTVVVAWDYTPGIEDYFQVMRSVDNINFSQVGTNIASTGASHYSYTDSTVSGGIYYYYKVIAHTNLPFSRQISSGSIGVQVASCILNTPVITGFNNVPCGNATLSWSYVPNGIEQNFYIWRTSTPHDDRDDISAYSQIAEPITATAYPPGRTSYSFIDSTAVAGLNYYYIVSAHTTIGGDRHSYSPYHGPDMKQQCRAIVTVTKSLIRINDIDYDPTMIIKANDRLKFRITVSNSGNNSANIGYICDTPSKNFINLTGLSVSGSEANNAGISRETLSCPDRQEGSITTPSYRFNVSGTKAAGGDNWIITYDATFIPTSTEAFEVCSNDSTLKYSDFSGNHTVSGSFGPSLCRTNAKGKGGVNFREVAP